MTASWQGLTGGARSSVWFIRTGTDITVGLRKAEVSAATIVDTTQVGT